jgi:hypothetical protein
MTQRHWAAASEERLDRGPFVTLMKRAWRQEIAGRRLLPGRLQQQRALAIRAALCLGEQMRSRLTLPPRRIRD